MESEPQSDAIKRFNAQEILEVKGQYTSAVIGLLKEAIRLKKDREYWDALNHLGTLVSFIIKRTREDYDYLNKAVTIIHDTERLASTITGPTVEIRQATIDLFRNDVGRIYFNPTLEFIQDRLKSMGVYNAVHGFSGIDPNIIDDIPDEALDVY